MITEKIASWTHCTALAPGCHGGPDRLGSTIISRHRSEEAAIRSAKKNDRLVACTLERLDHGDGHVTQWAGREIYLAEPQGDLVLGAGRYGRANHA